MVGDNVIEHTGICSLCGVLGITQCDVCEAWLCPQHTCVRHQSWDTALADGVDLLCQTHVQAKAGHVIQPYSPLHGA
jgi:hypothetical protein